MFKKYISKQDITYKWAMFKVGDSVLNLKEHPTSSGLLKKSTKLTVERILTDIEPPGILPEELNNYELVNQKNAFLYVVKDESGNEFRIEESALIDAKADEVSFKKALEETKRTEPSDIIYAVVLALVAIGFIAATIAFIILGTLKLGVFTISFGILFLLLAVIHPVFRSPRLRKLKRK